MDTEATRQGTSDRAAARVLPVLPVPEGVVLPETVVTVSVESDEARAAAEAAAGDRQILLVPRIEGRFSSIGVLSTVEDHVRLPNSADAVTIRTLRRVRVGSGVVGSGAALWVETSEVDEGADSPEVEAAALDYRAAARALLDRVGGRRLAAALPELETPGALADSIGYWPELTLERRLELLETVDVATRLELATSWAKEAIAELDLREKIQREVSSDLEKGQREAILRRQMEAIRAELGETDDVISEYRARAAAAELPEKVAAAVESEIDHLERVPGESMEGNWIRTWLDTVLDLPWTVERTEQTDLGEARAILDADHTGLDKVKDRIIEHLAVRKLRAARALPVGDDRRRGVILSLVGPPGVGKTSLGESVARAMGRDFVRLALGGIRDEAEIRGHRRTYVGARPGRVVRALSEAGSMNPVVLLDEVDKVGADWRGDPSSALLEVLDPAQNHSFRDHYLEFELDLSGVVFLATANVVETIPGPLLDRMEVIELDGYTDAEKAAIARDHLLPRLLRANGVATDEVVIADGVIETVASNWTREAGVRRLERLLDRIVRKAATRIATDAGPVPVRVEADDLVDLIGRPIPSEDHSGVLHGPGMAKGLAVTGAGGDVLLVETALVPGEGEPLLTGQLGDVMKESAAIALSVVSGLEGDHAGAVPGDRRLHVHFPAGAVPKDGPSAGVTMTTALVSLLSGRPVRSDVAMTGEVTLAGRVLPVGGIKQKVLAAHRSKVDHVLIPAGNGPDLDEVPDYVLEDLEVHLVETISEVLDLAMG